jgi:hypothetical protein
MKEPFFMMHSINTYGKKILILLIGLCFFALQSASALHTHAHEQTSEHKAHGQNHKDDCKFCSVHAGIPLINLQNYVTPFHNLIQILTWQSTGRQSALLFPIKPGRAPPFLPNPFLISFPILSALH